MISEKNIEIVKSTAPVLKSHGHAITTEFYKRLFFHHPELRNLFNMTHQATGKQPSVLAMTILQYAEHIDRLDALSGAVHSIAQKHSSLHVKPEMYPIVGKYLIEAIKAVLGEAASPAIIAAWTEAYDQLAEIFIHKEENAYQANEKKKGGYRGFSKFVLTEKLKESETITSFHFYPKDGKAAPSFLPGQYIAISLQIPGEKHLHTRNYSLSDIANGKYLRISVKRESGNPAGIVSNYLHDHLAIGDSVNLGMPSGSFTLAETQRPVLLLAGGTGITPLLPMYKTLHATNKKAVLIQCSPNSATMPFGEEIKQLQSPLLTHIIGYSDPLPNDLAEKHHAFEGFLTKSILERYLPSDDPEVYFCGPKKFMQHVNRLLEALNIDPSRRHFEFFGPAEEMG